MKKFIATIALTVIASATAFAGEVTYIAGMTGVTWGGCKKDVGAAFSQLSGYKSHKIENGDEAGTQKVTVVTDGSKEVSKKDAVKSLGDKAAKYVVQTWAESKAES